MQSIELIRTNLNNSTTRVLARIEEMREHCMVPPTAQGGGHTLWVLGHLAYIEALVVHVFMSAQPNPLAHWDTLFDGDLISVDPKDYPPFEQVVATCWEQRAGTLALLDTLGEDDLDQPVASVPAGYDEFFGTRRRCLQYLADHWYMHRGQLADARRSAGIERMWV